VTVAGVVLSRPLPGIVFAPPAAAPDDALPRMDIAGFVGFAERGPVDVPVAIADPAHFEEVFGGEVALFRDIATGEVARGHLAAAVSAFFAEGGQRCWVVRVTARNQAWPYASSAAQTLFDLTPPPAQPSSTAPRPALSTRTATGQTAAVRLPARSVGSWASGVRAGVAVLRAAVRLSDVRVGAKDGPGGRDVRCRLVAGALSPYDLVEVVHPTGRLLFAVTSVDGDAVYGAGGLGIAPEVDPGVDAALDPDPGSWPAVDYSTATAAPLQAYVLTLELRTSGPAAQASVLTGIGCVPGHPRYLGDLPTDEDLARLALAAAPGQPRLTALQSDVATTGFPLAAPPEMAPTSKPRPIVYPDADLPAVPDLVGASQAATGLDADGLPALRPALFIDPRLDGVGVLALPGAVEQLRDVQEQPLLGLHSLLALDEVTLLALPDAVQRPWAVPAAPRLVPEAEHQTYRAERVCGHDNQTGLHDVPTPELPPPAPEFELTGSTVHLSWPAVAGATFVVQESIRPWTWDGAVEVYRGGMTTVDLYGRGPGNYRYRVRAETAEAASDWSATLRVDIPDTQPWTTVAPNLRDLRTVQLAAITAAAARGDLLAVLTAGPDMHAEDAGSLVEALRTDALNDDRLLSFGALYHPWTVPVSGVAVPPDGAAAGVLASTAAGVGCWREPANVPLASAVALTPPEPPAAAVTAAAAGTNLLLERPRGRLALSAYTLSRDPDLSRIAVRRLLSLLRRLALRYGPTFVFEPNDAVLRRHVRRQFEAVLAQLLAAGAFAGPAPQDSYQVVVTNPVDTQLLVELKVAPAAAMRWLIVRLVGNGDQFSTAEAV
jgi:hypothetical protein